jgi:hypothetical protein
MANSFSSKAVLLAALMLPLSVAASEPVQLDITSFAGCLAQEQPSVDLGWEVTQNHLGGFDLLLPYLALYAGTRIPVVSGEALRRWSGDLEHEEESLARSLSALATDDLAPGRIYREALAACGSGDAFCAALISHNVLRTLGRPETAIETNPITHVQKDFNPAWYKANPEGWLARAAKIQNVLFSLRRDGSGDRWGDNYHFFGLFTFVVHEMALFHEVSTARLVARMDQVLNPILVGELEEPLKAEIDRESVEVAADYLKGMGTSGSDCRSQEGYVLDK